MSHVLGAFEFLQNHVATLFLRGLCFKNFIARRSEPAHEPVHLVHRFAAANDEVSMISIMSDLSI